MKTLFLSSLFAVLMTTAQAEGNWLFIAGGSPDLTGTRLSFFYDPNTILVPNEDTRQVAILAEYVGGMQSAMTFGISEVSVITFDCQTEKLRTEHTNWYELPQAQGRLTKTFERSVWQPIYYTNLKTIRNFICSY